MKTTASHNTTKSNKTSPSPKNPISTDSPIKKSRYKSPPERISNLKKSSSKHPPRINLIILEMKFEEKFFNFRHQSKIIFRLLNSGEAEPQRIHEF